MKKSFLHSTSLLFLFAGMATTLQAQDFPWNAAPVPLPFGLNDLVPFTHVKLYDFDGDGITEAFIMTGENRYYENTGDDAAPQFVLAETNPFGIPPFTGVADGFAFDFVDIDGDCDPDIFLASLNDVDGNPLLYLENTGSPDAPWFGDSEVEVNPFGFVQPVSDSVPGQLWGGFSWPSFVDIDADNDYDLFFSGRFLQPNDPVFDENIYFYRNDDPSGKGTSPQFTGPIKNPFNLTLPAEVPDAQVVSRFVDMDCDGDWDLFATYAGTLIAYFENTGTPAAPHFSDNPVVWWANNPPPPPGFDHFIFGDWMDVGGDGDMDFMGGNPAGFFYWENISDGTMACQRDDPQYVQCLPPARVQFIHAATFETVRLVANGETLREVFAYQTATPFMDVPSGVPLDVEVIVTDPWSSSSDMSETLTFEPGQSYIVALQGTFDESDPYPVEFTLFEDGREEGSHPDNVDILILRGAPDIPFPTDVVVEGGPLLADDVMYGEFGADYVSLPAGSFIVSPTPADDNTILLDPFAAHMGFWKGRTAVGFTTGLVTEGTFQPWIALSNGGTFPLFPPPGQRFAPLANRSDTYPVEWPKRNAGLEANLAVYPNPTGDWLTVNLFADQEFGNLALTLTDPLGRQVLHRQLDSRSSGFVEQLNLSSIAPGIYILTVMAGDKLMVRKIQKVVR